MLNGRAIVNWFRKITNRTSGDTAQPVAAADPAPAAAPAAAADPAPTAETTAAAAPVTEAAAEAPAAVTPAATVAAPAAEAPAATEAAPAAGAPAGPAAADPPAPALPVDLGPGAPEGLATAATGPQEDIPAGVNPALSTPDPDAEAPAVAGLLRGVDVSSFQGTPTQWRASAGTITWAAVKITELEPSGLHYVNPDAAADWAFLHQQGHVRVAYMFGHPSVSASASVTWFLQKLRPLGLNDTDAIALDIEVTDGLSASAVDAWCVAVLEALEHQTGRRPIVYTFLNFAAEGNVSRLGKYPLWIADPSSPMGHPRVPSPWTTWTMHQYAITGNIDRDVAKFNSRADMSAHLGVSKEPVLKDLGGTITSALASARWESGVTVVAGIGKDGHIQVIRWANGKWGNWKDVGTDKALHPPAVLVWGKETGHLYYTAQNGHVIEISTQDAGVTWS